MPELSRLTGLRDDLVGELMSSWSLLLSIRSRDLRLMLFLPDGGFRKLSKFSLKFFAKDETF